MFERFTRPAREVVVRAQEEAGELDHDWIGTEHLLLALLRRPEAPGASTLSRLGVTAENCRHAVRTLVTGDTDALTARDSEALRTLGIDLDEIRRHADAAFGEGALDRPVEPDGERPRRRLPFGRRRSGHQAGGHIPFTPRAKQALALSLREAVAARDGRIGVEHLVLALLRSEDRLTTALFEHLGVEAGTVRDLVLADLRRTA